MHAGNELTYCKDYLFFAANFQNSVTKDNDSYVDDDFRTQVRFGANDNKNRERDVKSLNVSSALIAYYPSTPPSKCNNLSRLTLPVPRTIRSTV